MLLYYAGTRNQIKCAYVWTFKKCCAFKGHKLQKTVSRGKKRKEKSAHTSQHPSSTTALPVVWEHGTPLSLFLCSFSTPPLLSLWFNSELWHHLFVLNVCSVCTDFPIPFSPLRCSHISEILWTKKVKCVLSIVSWCMKYSSHKNHFQTRERSVQYGKSVLPTWIPCRICIEKCCAHTIFPIVWISAKFCWQKKVHFILALYEFNYKPSIWLMWWIRLTNCRKSVLGNVPLSREILWIPVEITVF